MANNGLSPEQRSAIGHEIVYYEVLGEEADGERCVGVDMRVIVAEAGSFSLNAITKARFRNENVGEVLDDIDHPEELTIPGKDPETRPPFVLNDSEINDDVLDRKFSGRVVEADLAASLWPLDTEQ